MPEKQQTFDLKAARTPQSVSIFPKFQVFEVEIKFCDPHKTLLLCLPSLEPSPRGRELQKYLIFFVLAPSSFGSRQGMRAKVGDFI
ncbi:MAG: hypothetical protein EAZ92_09810 [Candidatus Kapaibacterium sp.]|nr:MAG: hypothetical protein EAZ92_09810 [Candidatus Kapabacteria bacterium]